MTTSMPQFCRAALSRRHAGGTCPLRGPWLIGLPRINRRLWAAVSRIITLAAAPAHVSHLARTRRGREPSKLVLAVLHPGLLSPKELRLDSSAAHTGILLRHRQGLDHSVSNSRERAESSFVAGVESAHLLTATRRVLARDSCPADGLSKRSLRTSSMVGGGIGRRGRCRGPLKLSAAGSTASSTRRCST